MGQCFSSLPELYDGPHLQLINPIQVPNSSRSFHLFSEFPPDLRDLIWWHSLARERLLLLDYEDTEAAKSPLISTSCVVNVTQRLETNAILFVNKESREAALRFYRLRIPCYNRLEGSPPTGILYFNPDFDIIDLSAPFSFSHWCSRFVTLSQDLQKADPQRLGIKKIAIPQFREGTARLDDYVQIDELKRAMSGLCCVMFIMRVPRRIYGTPRNGMLEKYRRSFPINSTRNPYFDRLPQDPRPIGPDLKGCFYQDWDNIYFPKLRDVRSFVSFWINLRETLGVEIPCEHKLILSSNSSSYHPRARILGVIKRENRYWQRALHRNKKLHKMGKGVETAKELKTAPQTAVGFWIFPLEALGTTRLEESLGSNGNFEEENLLDLSRYHPELALFDLE